MRSLYSRKIIQAKKLNRFQISRVILADKDILLHDAQMARLFVQHLQTIIPAQKHKSLPKVGSIFCQNLNFSS